MRKPQYATEILDNWIFDIRVKPTKGTLSICQLDDVTQEIVDNVLAPLSEGTLVTVETFDSFHPTSERPNLRGCWRSTISSYEALWIQAES